MPSEKIELPPLPEGDESKDTKVFRFVGRGGRYRKYECWEDAVHEYAKSYALLAVKQENERCARVCEQMVEKELGNTPELLPLLRSSHGYRFAAAIRQS